MTLSSNWKVKNFTTSLIKSWSWQFLPIIDFVAIKIFIIASAKILWPWRPRRLEIGREHFIRVWLYRKVRTKNVFSKKQFAAKTLKRLYLTFPPHIEHDSPVQPGLHRHDPEFWSQMPFPQEGGQRLETFLGLLAVTGPPDTMFNTINTTKVTKMSHFRRWANKCVSVLWFIVAKLDIICVW